MQDRRSDPRAVARYCDGVNASIEKKTKGAGSEEDALGAGDQGMMFGYACRETEELMPLPILLSHKLAMRLTRVRKSGLLPYLRPDGKTQVTVEYDDKRAVRVDAVVVSSQHDREVSQERLRADIRKYVVDEVIPAEFLDADTKFYINPTGRFEIGGPEGDSGLTGRKIIVDTYGGAVRTAAELFRAKTAQRWTGARRIFVGISPRIWWRRDLRTR